MAKKARSPTSGCCCIGVKCPCPPGKVCASLKRDKKRIHQYIIDHNLTEEESEKYVKSIYKDARLAKKKKSAAKKKSAKKSGKKKSVKNKKKSAKKSRSRK